jgi:serine/threonine protein kinase
MYVALFGHFPFSGPTPTAIMEGIMHKPLQLPDKIDPQLREVLCGLLEKDATKRMTLRQLRKHPYLADLVLLDHTTASSSIAKASLSMESGFEHSPSNLPALNPTEDEVACAVTHAAHMSFCCPRSQGLRSAAVAAREALGESRRRASINPSFRRIGQSIRFPNLPHK